jgi:hypothetical protein
MNQHISATIVDESTVSIDGRLLAGVDEVASALSAALQRDPGLQLVIGATPTEHFRGLGTVIYASQRVGMPLDNLRFTMADGALVSFAELRELGGGPV